MVASGHAPDRARAGAGRRLNAPAAFAAALDRGALARARIAYNEGRYDAAIGAARQSLEVADQVDAARLVLARALLERYRAAAEPRTSSKHATRCAPWMPRACAAGERDELLVGFGQWLFLTGRFGAAAGLFESALGSGDDVARHARSPARLVGQRTRSRGAGRATATRTRSTRTCARRGWNRKRGRSPRRAARPVTGLPRPRAGLGELDRAWQAAMAAGCGPACTQIAADVLRGRSRSPGAHRHHPRSRPRERRRADDQRQAADTMVTRVGTLQGRLGALNARATRRRHDEHAARERPAPGPLAMTPATPTPGSAPVRPAAAATLRAP